ncbi:MAG: HAD family phosphatase [Clostridia bacterium]|nr:HAD family phosphatase [Clostridia bacterium]
MFGTLIDERFPRMPWERFDTVVFDVGNVLLRFDPEKIMEEFIPARWHDAVREHVFHSPYWVAMDHGLLSLAEAADRFAGLLPEIGDEVRAMLVGWTPMKEVVPEGVAALRLCREKGKRVCILSNYGDEAFSTAEENHAFLREADVLVVSSRVGVMKPDPQIYRILTQRCGSSPARTLFVDDNAQNIAEALAMGWEALWAPEPSRIARFFGV